jgi:uncharacterized protein (DUF488 family)
VADVVHSLGHSTRTGGELLALLAAAGVRRVADVRRFPGSRRHPQFVGPALARSLGEAGIEWLWLGETLGGRVPETVPPEASPNGAWTEPAFRRYADWMATPAFAAGLARLEAAAREAPTAILCAERPWWRCHRRLLADALVVRGWRVLHGMEPGEAPRPHALSEWARLEGGRLVYPALV